MLSLEAAAECHKLIFFSIPHTLFRRLALVCAENGDFDRSFRYYGHVLAKAQADGNVDEYAFVSGEWSFACACACACVRASVRVY